MEKKAMICQPMNGKQLSEIIETRNRAISWLMKNGFAVVNTLFTGMEYTDDVLKAEGVQHNPVYFLSKSFEVMSMVDAVYFCSGWDKARGCQAEHFVAKSYGLRVIYED